jgi:FkbM family methyltransferase
MSIGTKIEGIWQIMQFDNRWELLVNRIFRPSRNLLVYKYRGIEFITDHAAGDANGAREVLTTDMYRKFLSELEFSGPLNVLDIGANNGGFPLLIAAMGFSIKRVVSVEVNPKTFRRLAENLERNFAERAKALNRAICNESRMIQFFSENGGVSDNIYRVAENGESAEVKGISFDELVESEFGDDVIDICKIDIESAEFEIFAGKNYQRLGQCLNLLIEIHHDAVNDRRHVIDAIRASGFEEVRAEDKDDEGHYVHFFQNRKAVDPRN